MAESYFKVFYSKDVKKKKKTYAEGVFQQGENKIKLYDEESKVVYDGGIRSMYYHNVETEDEFILSNTYYVSIDRPISKESFLNGTAFMAKQVPVLAQKKVRYKSPEKQVQIQPGSIQLNSEYRIDAFLAQKLRPHQVEGIKFMFDCITGTKDKNNYGCILADYMGLGKTLQTLALLYSCLKNVNKNNTFKKAIVVSPLSLVRVWQKQHQKWLKDRIIPLVASGDGQNVKNKVNSFVKDKYRLLFLSYQYFRRHAKTLHGCCDIIVFDEGHQLKNDDSKRYKDAKSFSCKRRILLTGTPLQNNMNQFYACISLVNPNLFVSETLFKNLFTRPIEAAMKSTATEYDLKIGFERSRQLTNVVRQFSLRRKGDVLQDILPSKQEYHVFLPLTEIQEKWSKKFTETSNGRDIMFLTSSLRKLLISPQLFKQSLINKGQNFLNYSDSIYDQTSLKLQFIMNVSRNCSKFHEKLVVVSNFTQNLTLVQNLLESEEVLCFRLDGGMNDNTRQIQIEKFRNSNHGSVFLLSSKAGGTGLNLTVANKMIMMEPDWNPSNDQQVMGRLWRDGQTKPVHIYRLISLGTFEEKMLQRQYLKQNLSDKLIDSSSTTKLFNLSEMKNLITSNQNRCITYGKSDNQLHQIAAENYDFKECHPNTFVYIKKNKNNLNGVNEFDDEDMFLQVEKQEDEDKEYQEEEQQVEQIPEKTTQVYKKTTEVQLMKQNNLFNSNNSNNSNTTQPILIIEQKQLIEEKQKTAYERNILKKIRKPIPPKQQSKSSISQQASTPMEEEI